MNVLYPKIKFAIKIRFATLHVYDVKSASIFRDMNKTRSRKFFAIGKMRGAMNVRIT